MKITNRLFSYPVLCDDKDDLRYEVGEHLLNLFTVRFPYSRFIVDAELPVNDIYNINMNFDVFTDCFELQNLIDTGYAEYLIHLECAATAFRTAIASSVQQISCHIPINKVNGIMDRTVFIVLRRDIEDFTCADWNDDFDNIKISLPKGSILAYKNLLPLNIQKQYEEFKNTSSMFRVHKLPEDMEKPIDINLDKDNIYIGLNAAEYDLYNRYCKMTDIQPLLNSLIILPALVYIIDEIRQEMVDYTNRKWYKSLIKNNLENEIYDSNKKSIELAQKIMELPIGKALGSISNLYSTNIED